MVSCSSRSRSQRKKKLANLSETSMSICSGRWWCGACPEPTSCLFTSTSIHQSGILIYRPSKRLGSSSTVAAPHTATCPSNSLKPMQSVSHASPIGRGQMVALQCHGLQSGFWIGLDWRKKLLEPAGACMSINPNVSRLQSSPAAAILE